MIKVPPPSMALNSHDVPGAKYEMEVTFTVPAYMSINALMDYTADRIHRSISSHRVKCLILNCHGAYKGGLRHGRGGYGLSMGQGIDRSNNAQFAKIKGKVTEIWITACGTARISPGADGNLLCQEIAKSADAYVVAATTHQDAALWLPTGYIDGWEGLVVRYNPEGICVGKTDHGRSFIDGLFHGWN